MSENAAAQVGPEVALDPCGHAGSHGIRLGGLCEERLEVVLDQRIERRQGWTAPAVDDFVTHVINLIAREGIQVKGFRTEVPTLEDVFLKLTGHGVRD